MQQNPNSQHGAPSPEYTSALGLSDSVEHQQSEQPSSVHPNQGDFKAYKRTYRPTDSTLYNRMMCVLLVKLIFFSLESLGGRSAHRHIGEKSESTGKTSDLSTSPPASCCSHENKREEVEQPLSLHRRERLDEEEKHRDPQTDTAQGSPLKNKFRDKIATPEHDGRRDGSLDRKRQRDCNSAIKAKRVKQEIIDDQLDSSKALLTNLSSASTAHMRPSSCTIPHINISGQLSVLYPETSRYVTSSPAPGGFNSYPGAETYPYLTAPWEPAWFVHKSKDLHSRQIDYSLNTCKGIRIPLAAQGQKEAFQGVFMAPFHFPPAYLTGKEFLYSHHENRHLQHCGRHLPHAGLLATSYLGP